MAPGDLRQGLLRSFFHRPATVKLVVDVTEAFIGYMGVYLRGRNVPMTQKFLNRTQVNPLRQQISGKRMA